MRLVKRSGLSRKEHTTELPMTEKEFMAAYITYRQGGLIQECFPTLSADQREFILTGITPEEWAKAFPPEED